MHPPSFLVNERIAIDAGALSNTLSLEEQARITHIFLSHSHMDHLCTLPFLLDNVLTLIHEPISLYAPGHTVRCLREHLFNGCLWPDFTTISNRETVVIQIQELECGQTVQAHNVEITPFPLDHEVECHGHLLQENGSSLIICSDTASAHGLVGILPQAVNLKAVVLEASFPNRLAHIADLSRHLSTGSFSRQVHCVPRDVPVLVSHLKPGYVQEIRKEITALGMENVSLLEQGREYRF